MPHPKDMNANGLCKVCGDRLSPFIRKKDGKRAYRRHLTNRDYPTKGRGEAM